MWFHGIEIQELLLHWCSSIAGVCASTGGAFWGIPGVGSIFRWCECLLCWSPLQGRAFPLAHFNVLPLAYVEGRYNKIPKEKRYCSCDIREVETLVHSFHCCLKFKAPRGEIFSSNNSEMH
uniref:Uncharacterized protein n=1 Tax=Sphaerodactylus townsendi TaxID=933632 RepID=A0ACB8F928_9SAUR